MWGGNWDMVISSKWWIYSILQYDEIAGGTDTWEDVCQQFGIDLASSGTETDNTFDSGSKGSEHEVENIDSSGVETDNTSDNGSKQGSEHEVDSSSFEEVRKREKVKQRRVNKRKIISSSSSDEEVQQKRSDSESPDDSILPKTSKKPLRILVDGLEFFQCAECDHKSKSSGKTYSHMVEEHGMDKFECNYCHFTTQNKTSMMNHKAKYCRQLKNKEDGGDAEGIPKPETKYIDRVRHFCCTHCDFVAKSSGKVYSHMVADHGYKKLVCDFCKLSTANATSFHNHKTKYCRSLKTT